MWIQNVANFCPKTGKYIFATVEKKPAFRFPKFFFQVVFVHFFLIQKGEPPHFRFLFCQQRNLVSELKFKPIVEKKKHATSVSNHSFLCRGLCCVVFEHIIQRNKNKNPLDPIEIPSSDFLFFLLSIFNWHDEQHLFWGKLEICTQKIYVLFAPVTFSHFLVFHLLAKFLFFQLPLIFDYRKLFRSFMHFLRLSSLPASKGKLRITLPCLDWSFF